MQMTTARTKGRSVHTELQTTKTTEITRLNGTESMPFLAQVVKKT